MNKSDLLPIELAILSVLQEHFKRPVTELSFVLGVSGGADSMSLLHIFHRLKIETIVVHINYRKRGSESEKDAELVEQMAHEWGFDCESFEADPKEVSGTNFQQWAREFRYHIFNTLYEKHGATGIALAHHEDDQIETILQKLFRGAGLESWSAMETWDGHLFRPLLHTSRQDIEAYCKKNDIPFRTDQTNLTSDFARNFLRNEWVHDLQTHFPGWKKNVLRISEQATLFTKTLDSIADDIVDEKDRISRKSFLKLDKDLSKALLLHILKNIDPDISVGHAALAQLNELNELQTGKSMQLNSQYFVLRDREWFKIVYEQPQSLTLITLERDTLAENSLLTEGLQFKIKNYENPDFEKVLCLDTEKISWPVTLRNWRQGDSFQPFGMQGHQNISDHLTNRKVSADHKASALVLEDSEETICAVLFPPFDKCVPPGTISELVRCHSKMHKSLTIKHVD